MANLIRVFATVGSLMFLSGCVGGDDSPTEQTAPSTESSEFTCTDCPMGQKCEYERGDVKVVCDHTASSGGAGGSSSAGHAGTSATAGSTAQAGSSTTALVCNSTSCPSGYNCSVDGGKYYCTLPQGTGGASGSTNASGSAGSSGTESAAGAPGVAGSNASGGSSAAGASGSNDAGGTNASGSAGTPNSGGSTNAAGTGGSANQQAGAAGSAGMNSAGSAGSTAQAGATSAGASGSTGTAGTASGAAGTGGSTNGAAGSTNGGSAGTSGSAGSEATGGSSAAGESGSSGSAGTTDVGGASGAAGNVNLAGSSGDAGAAGSSAGTGGDTGSAGTSGGSISMLTFQPSSVPPSQIVIGGKDAWVPFSRYMLSNPSNDELLVVKAHVRQTHSMGDNADFANLALFVDGKPMLEGVNVLSDGNIELTMGANGGIKVPAASNLFVEVMAKMAKVENVTALNNEFHGVARSGHVDIVSLQDVVLSTPAGELTQSGLPGAPNHMVLRKSMPVVNRLQPSSTVLANINQDLYQWHVHAEQGAITWKQVMFSYAKTSSVSLYSFGLRRDGFEVDPGSYAITAEDGTDLKNGFLSASKVTGNVFVSFTSGNEELVGEAGKDYSLHAYVAGATAGQVVSFGFTRNSIYLISNWMLVNNLATDGYPASPDIFHLSNSDTQVGALGTFIWSDLSAVPHSPDVLFSRDWTNDTFLQDLSSFQQLTLLSYALRFTAPVSSRISGLFFLKNKTAAS
jgi:hypothetical protein